MYIGRFVVIAPGYGAYRVSSRSFPDRVARETEGGVAVVPEEEYDNPYVSYDCLRRVDDETAVLGNGTHVAHIAEKMGLGYPARDALAEALLALDYERDDYNTPRIAGTVAGDASYIGIVRDDALLVERVTEPTLVATYEEDEPRPVEFGVSSADEAARRVYGMEYEHPVASCAVHDGEVALYNGDG